MKPLNIDSDEYRYEACSITGEECGEYSCKTCEIACAENEEIEEIEDKSVYTFRHKNDDVEVNQQNTVAKSKSLNNLMCFVFKSVEKPDYKKLLSWDEEKINNEFPHFKIVMEKLNLNNPKEIFYYPKFPLISNHGNVVLAVAPQLMTGECSAY